VARSAAWGIAVVVALALLVAGLTGCGGRSPQAKASSAAGSTCGTQATAAADDGLKILVRAGSESMDVTLFSFQDRLAELQRARCEPRILGDALVKRLSSGELRSLLASLPSSLAGYVRVALACSGRAGVRRAGAGSACSGSSSASPIAPAKPAGGGTQFTP
jgi:hypothetical protein